MKQFTSKPQKTGELGEKICAHFLKKNKYNIVEQNYTQKTGEIDIIAIKNGIIHFIEVKSIRIKKNVTHETYNPAENLTPRKLEKIKKTIQYYMLKNKVSYETRCQIDLYCVFINEETKNHKVFKIENIT